VPSDGELASLAAELRAAIGVGGLVNTIAAPMAHSQLLELIVKTAAHVLHARAGSLLLLDETRHELVFTVSATEDISQFRDIRIPLGTGIAGLVALSGQPMAVADAQSDPRHATDIAAQTGYLPRSLLCVPLTYKDAVIGVLELLDKQGAPFFDADDIHALSLFANQAAIAIQLSHTQQDLARLLRSLLGSIDAEPANMADRVTRIAADLHVDPDFARATELAALIHEVVERGPKAADMALAVMRAVATYARS
jgi:GAF domain-containing protein